MRFGNRHMTKAERAAFMNVSGQQTWQAFRARLEAAHTMAEAQAVARSGPEKGAVGAALYANLATFLKKFEPASKTLPAERVLYRELVRRLEQAGEMEAEQALALQERLLGPL
jgi:hypothetical protein